MQSFNHFLKEEVETKLKHIHHAEDRPLLHGPSGFEHAHGALMQAHDHIKSGGHSSDLAMKYDGSPAVVFGHHPENGKFFVASKSAFNKNPKINYTHDDIKANHGHAAGLMDKLHASLNHLHKITPKTGVYQGDLMHSHTDLENSKHGVSFTPNTIKYTAKGDEADKVRKSKIGVVVHTQYHGKDIGSMKADSHPDVHNFAKHPDVWYKSAEHDTKQVHYSDADQAEFKRHLEAAKDIHNKGTNRGMYAATAVHRGDSGPIQTYINQTVRNDEKPSTEGLKKHVEGKYKYAVSKLKSPQAQSRKEQEGKKHLEHIDKNENHYGNLFQMHHHLQQAKNVLVKTLNQHQGGLEHHIGDKRTDPEGFVINHRGEPTKLVNRAEFSKANLLKVRK